MSYASFIILIPKFVVPDLNSNSKSSSLSDECDQSSSRHAAKLQQFISVALVSPEYTVSPEQPCYTLLVPF